MTSAATPYKKREAPEVFGARTFTIEVWERNRDPDANSVDSLVWLISKTNPKHRVRLPIPPSQSVFSFSHFVISPDEKVIIASHKICSGDNIVYVFHNTGRSLHYRLADKVSVNERIGRKYGWPPDKSDPDRKYDNSLVNYVSLETWLPNGRDALLACHYGPRNKGVYYFVTLNTRTGALYGYQKTSEERVLGLYKNGDRFPQTRLRLLNPAEWAALSPESARAAIKEMFARRGSRDGVSQAAIKAMMTPTERENLALLTRMAAQKR